MQAESQILADVDYKIFCVDVNSKFDGRRYPDKSGVYGGTEFSHSTSFVIMTKRGETTDEDIDTLLLCNGRIFNPGHWMNEVLLVLSQKLIDVKSEKCLADYDIIAEQMGFPKGNEISVMSQKVVESLEALDIDGDNISRLNYIDEELEITL